MLLERSVGRAECGRSRRIGCRSRCAIASALSASGLVYRLGLMLVRRLPAGLVGQAAACLGSGLFLTLLLPSSTARARLLLPTALAAAQAQRFKERSPESVAG